MKTHKRKWGIAAIAAAILMIGFLCVAWLLQLQKPLCIELLGDGDIQRVEASCISSKGWQREELDQGEMKRLVRVMNGIKGERTDTRPHGSAYDKRMVFSVEKTDGDRSYMVLSDQTLTIDDDVSYLLSKKDAREIERLFGEIL